MNDLIETINRRFNSLNEIPVERVHITREEWDKLRGELECPKCGETAMIQLLGHYEPESPTGFSIYSCQRCGKTFDTSKENCNG